MADLLNEFKAESLHLIEQMTVLLENCESGQAGLADIEKIGLFADRIMGVASQVSLHLNQKTERIDLIVEFAELCKILGYKSSKLKNTQGLWVAAVGILLDATDQLRQLISGLDLSDEGPGPGVAHELVSRLTWLNEQFAKDIDGGVPISRVQNLIARLSPGTDES